MSEPSQELLEGFATVQRLLRANRAVEYEVTPAGLNVHLPGQAVWSVCRLVDFGGEHPGVIVPLPAEMVTNLVPLLEATPLGSRWSKIALLSRHDLRVIGPALCAAWDACSDGAAAGGQQEEPAG
jgi:hypothetical protein